MALFGWQPPRTVAPRGQGPGPTPPGATTSMFFGMGPTGVAPGTPLPALKPPPKPTFGGLGWESLNPQAQAAVTSAYQKAPAATQGAAFKAFGGPAGFMGALGTLGAGAPAPGLTYESLTPEAKWLIGQAFGKLTPAQQAEVVKAYGSGNLMGALPLLGLGEGTGFTAGSPQWWALTPGAQAAFTAHAATLSPTRQAAAQAAMRSGGFGAALPLLGQAGPDWGDLTPETQNQIMAAYNALEPAKKAAADAAFAKGGVAAALPYLAPEPEPPTGGRLAPVPLTWEAMGKAAQEAYLARYKALSPEAQAAAVAQYQTGGLAAAGKHLGLEPIRFQELSTAAQQLAVERFNRLGPGAQAVIKAYAERNPNAGIEAYSGLLAKEGPITLEDLQPFMPSTRQAKKDVRPLRESVLPEDATPPHEVGELGNRLGKLHGAVRAIARDVAAMKQRRKG